MQESSHRATAGNGELNFTHPARQPLGGLFISPVCQRLGLLRQFVSFQMRVCSDAVKVCRMQPVLAAESGIFFLARFLLPEHGLL